MTDPLSKPGSRIRLSSEVARTQPSRPGHQNQTRDHLSSVFCSLSSEAGGAERIRTDDPLLAKQVLSQLSYSPVRSQRSTRKQPVP